MVIIWYQQLWVNGEIKLRNGLCNDAQLAPGGILNRGRDTLSLVSDRDS
jgi:hypothetical protein